MIKTSTPASRNLNNDKTGDTCGHEDLTEEDEAFYNHIQPQLNMIAKHPAIQTVEYIISYSRSL